MSTLTMHQLYTRLPRAALPIIDGVIVIDEVARKSAAYNAFNRLLEKFHNEGSWVGTMEEIAVMVYGGAEGFITLPRAFGTAIGIHGRAMPIQSKWFAYLPGGPGKQCGSEYKGSSRDMGDGFVTFRDIETPGQLEITPAQTEAPFTFVYIRGQDSSGNKIYSTVGGKVTEGIRIDLSSGATTTSQTFSRIYAITKDVTVGKVTISIGGDAIGIYEPGEQSISYRRYLVPGSRAGDAISVFAKRRWEWTCADNDPVWPNNIEAIKLGMMAINFEEQGDIERADVFYQRAIEILNRQLKQHRMGEANTLQWVNGLGNGSIPYIN